MTNLYRVRTEITGGPGGPGISTMYFFDTATAIPSVRTFWDSMGSRLPIPMMFQVQDTGDVIDDVTGDLVGNWAETPVAAVGGGSGSKYAAAVGAQVRWNTNMVFDSHRLRGRTFLVPLSSNCFDTNGSLVSTDLAAIRGYANTLIAEQSASFAIWHRPRKAKAATPYSPAVTARAGNSALVTNAVVPPKGAVLRSRRD